MFWILVALLCAASLSKAQDNCQCVSFFYCPEYQQSTTTAGPAITWKDEEATERPNRCTCKCEHYNEVCCDLGQGTSGTPGEVMTAAIDKCGQRGKPPKEPNEPTTVGGPGIFVNWKITDPDGQNARYAEFPWMVAIMDVSSGTPKFLCGGSIITPNVILTTAHTLKSLTANELSVKAGVWNTSDENEANHQDRAVDHIVKHSGFDQVKIANDFALLFLRDALQITNNVATVCLPTAEVPVNRTDCIATGWGADYFGNPTKANVLKMVYIPVVEHRTCQAQLRLSDKLGPSFELHDSFICAGREKADTCTGDGGGPLMCSTIDDPTRFVQVGITSWGIECGTGIPGVYSSVQAASSWIQTYTVEENFDIRLGLPSEDCNCETEGCCGTTENPEQNTQFAIKNLCGVRGMTTQEQPEDQTAVISSSTTDGEDNTTTIFGEFPWMVAIMNVSSGTQEFLCGGSIITPYVILTAAHTLMNLSASQLSVKAGVWNISDMSETSKHQDRLVDRVVLHSAFDQVQIANDFALLFLLEPFNLTDNIATVCLPTSEAPFNKSNCVATGWGAGDSVNKTIQSVLKKVDLPIVEFSICQANLRLEHTLGPNFNLHDSFICAGQDEADTCLGDGGGPLMCSTIEDPNRFVLVGITSWGIGCNGGYPGLYSYVSAAKNWIENQVNAYFDSI